MKTESKSVYWQVHTENLLKEIVHNAPGNAMQATARPLDILAKILYVVADRARELNDPELNSLCCRLTLFTQSDPQSADYDYRATELVHEWDEKFLVRLNKKHS